MAAFLNRFDPGQAGLGRGQVAAAVRSPSLAGRGAAGEIPGLTSIRGLAAWWVVLCHAGFTSAPIRKDGFFGLMAHGYLAVDLFFILSGYVIALNYTTRLGAPGVRSWCAFLWLRLARIYPLHLFMLVLFVTEPLAQRLFANGGVQAGRFGLTYFLLSLGLLQGWGTSDPQWNYPAWSISTEWLAYIVFPLLLWLTSRVRRNRAASWTMAFASLLLLALAARQLGRSLSDDLTQLGPCRCLLEFWAGSCLFIATGQPRPSGNGAPLAALAAAFACFAVYVVLPVPDYLIMPLGFTFLVWALSFPSGVLARVMSARVLMFLGAISYSTYMVHAFVIDLVKMAQRHPGAWPASSWVACMLITLAASAALYRCVELPGRSALRRMDPMRAWARINRPSTALRMKS